MPQPSPRTGTVPDATARYLDVRQRSQALCRSLEPEDFVIQTMPDASPTKWHLAHVTWFFETFLLRAHRPGYVVHDPRYEVLFNSYYNAVGRQHPRPRRGLLSRPTVNEVMAYRSHVDEAMVDWLVDGLDGDLVPLLELGLNHEQQHQELLLMDIKHVLAQNPLFPVFQDAGGPGPGRIEGLEWIDFDGCETLIGHDGEGFAYDNERPRHRTLVEDYALADRCISNGEYLEFMRDGGYEQPLLWLSDGWSLLQNEEWRHPLYWVEREDHWFEYTLSGLKPLEPSAPVVHISLYEADAFAKWAGARLPTEAE